MARWEPGARERLVIAAVDLFTEQGYDATTVTEIAERAGVTKSTFFRHFPDKRELLVAGQETLSRLLAEGIAGAPTEASPLEAVAAGLERASGEMGPRNRELGPPTQGRRGREYRAPGAGRAEERRHGRRDDDGAARARGARDDRAPGQRDGRPRVQAGLRTVVRG
ncbi:TetR/AcrR family transcriptional regulator [Curtobacterium sp. MCJR17_043]|uniref:TetR/AcrR family transcriptional regulator n=1 Tax=Curtobacterium sp. MCJR17_043 TaxID=2175660 RepID=UPI0024DF7636|nr:TetR/AcrR family transcriptional regulator [Curtobacterium sp. MCJR17_043]WIB36010.1 helix-turn-helix domain-containing protein [Curtobacterium sp. MCJR17_043]